MVEAIKIEDEQLSHLLKKLDDCIKFTSELGIKLSSYGYYIRLGLNALQSDVLEQLIRRTKNNRELENNPDGYTMEYLGENNPKQALLNVLTYLKESQPKAYTIKKNLENEINKTILIADRNDVDYLKSITHNIRKVFILTQSELKKTDNLSRDLIFYSFNGNKDFVFLNQLSNRCQLILYEQEFYLYQKYLQLHKRSLEEEISSTNRFKLCEIKYEPTTDTQFNISQTIENIVGKIDDLRPTAYSGYKDESDSILEDIEDQQIHEISFNIGEVEKLESNDTVFSSKGDLLKVYKLNVGDKIRIYPKEQFAENLYNIAVETEPDIFGQVEQHSKDWLLVLKKGEEQFNSRDEYFQALKKNGLKVLPTTVDGYFKEYRKFPMYNSDIEAIFRVYFTEKTIKEIKEAIKPIKVSKRIYNSTMISLGKGLKQELKLFFIHHKIGEILEKRNFTVDALEHFITKHMPLRTIINIQPIEDGFTQ